MKNVLVLSGTASAINYINSLAGDPGVQLHISDVDPYCPGLYDPRVRPHRVPRARDTRQYREALDRILLGYAIDVLIPTSDYDVEGVVYYLNAGWRPRVAMFRPSWEAHQRLANKDRLMNHLQQFLPKVVPQTWRCDVDPNALPYPVVVKPASESGGKGVTIVQRAADLRAALARSTAGFGDGSVIQEFIPGRTYVTSLVYDQVGRLTVAVSMRSNLTFFTWGGGGCAGELVDDPILTQLCVEVIEACGGWCGPINLEWRHHEKTGQYYLLEANCRLNGYSYLTTMNGICLPRVVLSLLTGELLPPLELPPIAQRTNFVLGFRETPVTEWIGDA